MKFSTQLMLTGCLSAVAKYSNPQYDIKIFYFISIQANGSRPGVCPLHRHDGHAQVGLHDAPASCAGRSHRGKVTCSVFPDLLSEGRFLFIFLKRKVVTLPSGKKRGKY